MVALFLASVVSGDPIMFGVFAISFVALAIGASIYGMYKNSVYEKELKEKLYGRADNNRPKTKLEKEIHESMGKITSFCNLIFPSSGSSYRPPTFNSMAFEIYKSFSQSEKSYFKKYINDYPRGHKNVFIAREFLKAY